jgi:hypothetical protein
MSKKQQERKKKLREEVAKKRVLARRSYLRNQTSQNLQASRLERKFRQRADPFVKDEGKKKIMEQVKNEKILSKLEKNAEILKALENEYLNEMGQKKQFNEQLEAEGHLTLKDKMSALDQKARENMTEAQLEQGVIDSPHKND